MVGGVDGMSSIPASLFLHHYSIFHSYLALNIQNLPERLRILWRRKRNPKKATNLRPTVQRRFRVDERSLSVNAFFGSRS
jgi:hypothetical protein